MTSNGSTPVPGPAVREALPVTGARRGADVRRALVSAEFGLLVICALAFAGFGLLTQGFGSPFNLFGLARSGAVNVLIGLSMMTVIVSGGLDLSIGAIGVCSSIAAGYLLEVWGWPSTAGVVAGLLLGTALGGINGQLIVRTGMHSFVVTLATMSVFFGGMVVLTRARPFDNLPDAFSLPARLHLYAALSPLLVVSLLAACAMACLYRFTAAGRSILAVGANSRAALLSGLSVSHAITLCHVLAGLLAAIAGLMLSMRNGAAIPSMAGNLGQDWLLPAFLAPVLGGTPLSGGRVSVAGTVLGAALVTIIDNGLLLLHVGALWLQFFLGILLLGAVLLDKLRSRLLSITGRAG